MFNFTLSAKNNLQENSVLSIGGGLAAYLVLLPLFVLIICALRTPTDYLPFENGTSWSLDNIITLYSDPILYSKIIPDTLVFTISATFFTTIIGLLLAWLVERTDIPYRNILFWLILFPIMLPAPVLAMGWILLLGPNAGWLNTMLQPLLGLTVGPINIFSMQGLIFCQTLASVPFAFLLFTPIIRTMDANLEEASLVSGASSWVTFKRITLPILLPGILAPLMLVFLLTLEQFEFPLLIGLPAHINVFSYRILWELTPPSGLPNYGIAAAISLPFLGVGIILLSIYNWLTKKNNRFVTVTGRSYRRHYFLLGAWKAPALVFVIFYLASAVFLPIAVLIWSSIFDFSAPSLDILHRANFDSYRLLFQNKKFWAGLINTAIVSGFSATLVTIVSFLLGYIIVRKKSWISKILDYISFSSIGIPSVINALAVMLLYLSIPLGIYGTIWILVLAYSYRMAVTTRIVRSGLMQIQYELEDVSSLSGASWFTTQRKIIIPLISQGLISGFALIFILGIREFTMPLILYNPDSIVLSVLLLQFYEVGESKVAAALATVILFIVIALAFAGKFILYHKKNA